MALQAGLDGYDLIGDVHGCGRTLVRLLEKLGYRDEDGVYRHPRRKVIFLGDLIDRGPNIRLAVSVAKRMVDAGEAQIVMGNHEYNALAYCLEAPSGHAREWLRDHNPRNNRIIARTLEQFHEYPLEWESYLAWFLTLPLCLELDGMRVVHACWDEPLVTRLLERYPDGRIDREFLVESTRHGSFAHRVMDRLTRGTQIPLPPGVEIRSGDGFTRRSFRTHFWCRNPGTYGDVVFQPDNLPHDLEDRPLSDAERERLSWYPETAPPLFIGHYWCRGVPALPRANIACLDYSAVKCGRLVAYRWDGEERLDADRFVWVRVTPESIAGFSDVTPRARGE
ncbi:metallophosphoesterase [Salinicola peritrichatus]|uniref:metallophosphoesterase n=1 Tax=Salinicola peritrichatus TaxID=1267424 RepID=UPI000DA137C5|nr:metallophosphoesterase [Salinicola peritrichatus]